MHQNVETEIFQPSNPVRVIRKAHISSVKSVVVDEIHMYTASADHSIQIWNKKVNEGAL